MRKLFAFAITALVLQATPALAWVGGPWSGNYQEENSDGIYAATMILQGGVGLASWSQFNSTVPEISRYSESVVWYKGAVYFGTTFARVDVHARKVTGITNGESLPSFTGATGAAGPVGFCTTQWRGKVGKVSNALSFTAKGKAAFFGDYSDQFLPTQNITVQDQTVVINPVTGATSTTTVTTTTDIPGARGPNAAFPKYRTRSSVYVFGSRTSSTASTFAPGFVSGRVGFGGDAAAAAGGGGAGGGGGGAGAGGG